MNVRVIPVRWGDSTGRYRHHGHTEKDGATKGSTKRSARTSTHVHSPFAPVTRLVERRHERRIHNIRQRYKQRYKPDGSAINSATDARNWAPLAPSTTR